MVKLITTRINLFDLSTEELKKLRTKENTNALIYIVNLCVTLLISSWFYYSNMQHLSIIWTITAAIFAVIVLNRYQYVDMIDFAYFLISCTEVNKDGK